MSFITFNQYKLFSNYIIVLKINENFSHFSDYILLALKHHDYHFKNIAYSGNNIYLETDKEKYFGWLNSSIEYLTDYILEISDEADRAQLLKFLKTGQH